MSSDNWLWAQRAQELRFHQLDAARKQAESWRTGLAGLTSLFGAVLLVKGRDNLTSLISPYPLIVVALFGIALTFLVVATLSAIRAASGTPGDECLLTGEDLRDWTRAEVMEIGRRLAVARALTVGGIGAVAVAIGLAWLAPAQEPLRPLVPVTSTNNHYCGEHDGVAYGPAVHEFAAGGSVTVTAAASQPAGQVIRQRHAAAARGRRSILRSAAPGRPGPRRHRSR